MAQFSLLILNNCPLQSFSSCFLWWNKGLVEVVTFAQCCYTLSMGSIRIGQRTNYTHLGVPLLPSHQMIVIHNMSMTHGPRSYPSVATQVPLSLHFIQPWLWHSKSHRILLGLWRAFYLKSSWDHWLISCQQLKNCHPSVQVWNHKWAEVAPSAYYKSPEPLGRQSHCRKSRRDFCSVYRTRWAFFKAKVTPVYSLNEMTL